MVNVPEATAVRVYEAATEAAAMELMLTDARAMAVHGWVVSKRRWVDPATSGDGPRGRWAGILGAVRGRAGGRQRGSLWVVWKQAPVRYPQGGRLEGRLNPGGYCRKCGAAREVDARACMICGTEAHRPEVGNAR